MREKLTEFLKDKKSGKLLFIVGIVGIVLIYLSTFFSTESEKPSQVKEQKENFSVNEYKEDLEKQIKEMVFAISGDENAVITITLDTEMTFVYADEKKENNESGSNTAAAWTEQTYVTVTDSEGGESPLVVTTYMPRVRGVAIVCNCKTAKVEEKIQGAVMAALDITSRKIFISDKEGE